HASSPEKQPAACIGKIALHHAGNVVITMRCFVRHLPHLENRLPTVATFLNSAEWCQRVIVDAVLPWECCSAKMRPHFGRSGRDIDYLKADIQGTVLVCDL